MKKTYPYVLVVFAIIFSTFIWDYIKLPYDENNLIRGEFFDKKYNPINDTLRGLFFIFFPLLVFFVSTLRSNNSLDFLPNKKYFFLKPNFNNNLRNLNIEYITIIFFVFIIIDFLSLNFDVFLGTIDTHHEGPFLVAPLNYYNKDQIWLGTFFDYGFIGNNVGIIFSKFFSDYSVGINRFSKIFFILVNKFLLILICRKIVLNLSINKNLELFFILLSLAVLTLANYHPHHVTPFHPRIFIFLIFFLLLIEVLISNKHKPIISFIIGVFSLFSLFWYVDFGIYTNAILFLAMAFLIFQKQYFNLIIIISGIIFSWLAFQLIFPNEEVNEFFFQLYFLLNISDYLLGIEFPRPFSDGGTRHTKALLFIIISGIFLINFLFNKNLYINYKTKVILLFIFISSIILFKSGLMRSDGPHIKYSSGFYMLLIYFSFTYSLYLYFQNTNWFKKMEKIFKNKKFIYIIVILASFLSILNDNIINLKNSFNFKKNIFSLTKLNDENFLTKEYLSFINEFKKISKEDDCVQQFTDDNALPYFINKPTCTKFYLNSHIISDWTEEQFIKQLKDSNPKFIVYSSDTNWFKNRKNAPIADAFILNNYSFYKRIHYWEIYKIN